MNDNFTSTSSNISDLSFERNSYFTSTNKYTSKELDTLKKKKQEDDMQELDEFIANNKPDHHVYSPISSKDLRNAKEIYNEMQHSSNNYYELFGSNGCGITCFGLYKSKEQIIYLYSVRGQDLDGYMIIDLSNEYILSL